MSVGVYFNESKNGREIYIKITTGGSRGTGEPQPPPVVVVIIIIIIIYLLIKLISSEMSH